jgi:uncharacterized LabA/DUF88 family protein
VEIALDALELSAKYHTLILFSGDSDFDDLFKRLRLKKKHIVVISSKYHISKELIMSCHKYIDLKKLRPYIERRRIDRRIDKKSPSFSTGG